MRRTLSRTVGPTALLAAVLGGLGVSAPAWATPDLAGEWVLDPGASESIEPLLAAQGVPWALRKAAASAKPRLELTQSGDAITVVSHSPKGTTTEVFTTDNQPHATNSPDGKPATWTSRWEGDTLVSSRPVQVGSAETAGTLTLRRKRVDGRLHQTVELAIDGGATHRVLRVFAPVAG